MPRHKRLFQDNTFKHYGRLTPKLHEIKIVPIYAIITPLMSLKPYESYINT